MCPAVLTPTRLTNRAVLSFLVTAMIGQLGRNWAITNAVLQIKKKINPIHKQIRPCPLAYVPVVVKVMMAEAACWKEASTDATATV